MNCKTLIIDGPYLAHRSDAAPFNLTDHQGNRTTAIHTFFSKLNKSVVNGILAGFLGGYLGILALGRNKQ